MFFAAYRDEVVHPESEWRKLASNGEAGQRVFGLFDVDVLVGLTAVFTYNGDPSGSTAVLAMSYIRPEYRRRGLTRLFYDARLRWIHGNPHFRTIRVSHRRSNEASRRAIERHGFVRVGEAVRSWHDGATEEEVIYERRLGGAPWPTPLPA